MSYRMPNMLFTCPVVAAHDRAHTQTGQTRNSCQCPQHQNLRPIPPHIEHDSNASATTPTEDPTPAPAAPTRSFAQAPRQPITQPRACINPISSAGFISHYPTSTSHARAHLLPRAHAPPPLDGVLQPAPPHAHKVDGPVVVQVAAGVCVCVVSKSEFGSCCFGLLGQQVSHVVGLSPAHTHKGHVRSYISIPA